MKPIYVWAAMLLWSAVAVWIAVAAKKGMGRGVEEFFLAGRRLRGFISGMSYSATTYSAFMLVGLVGLTYDSGMGALGFEMTYLIFTVLFLVAFGPRFWLVGRKYGSISPPEMLGIRYESKWVAVVAAAICFVMLIPYSAVQLMGAGFLVNGLSGGKIPYMAGVLTMAILSGFCALWAGMRSVSWTDAFQALTMILTSIFALVYVMFHFFGSPAGFLETVVRENPQLLRLTWEPSMFVGLSLPWAFFALTNPQVAQRLFVPDTVFSLRRMILYFCGFGFLYTVISVLFGIQAANLLPGLDNPDQAMPRLLTQVPAIVGVIIFVGIFSAATSTLGSIVLTLSSLSARDIARRLWPEMSEEQETWFGRGSMLFLLLVCIAFAWWRPGLIAVLSSMASGGLLVMAPAIIGAFFWRRGSAAGALVSMAAGATVTAALYLTDTHPLGWWPPVWGLALTLVLYVGVSLSTRAPDRAEAFLRDLDRELAEQNLR